MCFEQPTAALPNHLEGHPMTVTSFPQLAERYLALWNETDPAVRSELVSSVCSADVRYTDPLADVTGPAELEATIAAVQSQFPGFVFTLTGTVDAHHQQARFTWDLGPAGAPAPIAGFDVVTFDESGRISQVLGFLDRVPA
jgi:hypothetical protein